MNKLLSLILLISFFVSIVPGSTQAAPSVPAFPGAEGWGAESVGGRGGRVIEVTTLADAFPAPAGSLRACIVASGPRICVFRVGGTIEIAEKFVGQGEKVSGFDIKNPYLTIAGQTAPGGGITLHGFEGLIFKPGAHDVIIRNIRIRLNGEGKSGRGQNYITVANNNYNVIIDHVSGSWTLDDGMSIGNLSTKVTVQNSLFAEGLAIHSVGSLIGTGEKELSLHDNLFAHNGKRNPKVYATSLQVINNVVYNWASRAGATAAETSIDYINNYYKPGPMSSKTVLEHESYDYPKVVLTPEPSIYITGNIAEGTLTNPSADNWELIRPWLFKISDEQIEDLFPESFVLAFPQLPQSLRRTTPLPSAPYPVTIQSALNAYNTVLNDVGANTRIDCQGNKVSNLDSLDTRIIADARNTTGYSSSPPVSPGVLPFIAPGTPCSDTDKDGMADEWENIHFGSLTVGSATDSSSDSDGDGYTDLEEFLNGTDPKSASAAPPPPPPPPIDPPPPPPPPPIDPPPPAPPPPIDPPPPPPPPIDPPPPPPPIDPPLPPPPIDPPPPPPPPIDPPPPPPPVPPFPLVEGDIVIDDDSSLEGEPFSLSITLVLKVILGVSMVMMTILFLRRLLT